MDIVELLNRALDQTELIIAGVTPNQLTLPTPCPDWNVETIIGHLVRGNENTAGAAEGKPRQPNPIADVGDDPLGAYRESVIAVKDAWQDRSLLAKSYQTPLGSLPGQALLTLRLSDNVVHGWDIAQATGRRPQYDADVVQTAMDFAQSIPADARGAGRPFAPAVSVPDDLPAIDRLAALLGRQPSITGG